MTGDRARALRGGHDVAACSFARTRRSRRHRGRLLGDRFGAGVGRARGWRRERAAVADRCRASARRLRLTNGAEASVSHCRLRGASSKRLGGALWSAPGERRAPAPHSDYPFEPEDHITMSAVAGAGSEAANSTTDEPTSGEHRGRRRRLRLRRIPPHVSRAARLRGALVYARGRDRRGHPPGRAARHRAARRRDAGHGRPADAQGAEGRAPRAAGHHALRPRAGSDDRRGRPPRRRRLRRQARTIPRASARSRSTPPSSRRSSATAWFTSSPTCAGS